jgi:hypothetical protein
MRRCKTAWESFRAFVRWTLANWFWLTFLLGVCLTLRWRIGESVLCLVETIWQITKQD